MSDFKQSQDLMETVRSFLLSDTLPSHTDTDIFRNSQMGKQEKILKQITDAPLMGKQ
jgi:hypothetical protein